MPSLQSLITEFQTEVNAVRNLGFSSIADDAESIFGRGYEGLINNTAGSPMTLIGQAQKLVAGASSNPAQWAKNVLPNEVQRYVYQEYFNKGSGAPFLQNIKELESYLTKNNVSASDIQSYFDAGMQEGTQRINNTISAKNNIDGGMLDSFLPMAAIGLSLLAPGLGTAIGSTLGASGAAATALGNAVIGGTLAEASGGDFMEGALAAGAGSLAGGYIAPEISSAVGSDIAGKAITSGLLSEAQGGDFLSGAVSGAISGAANEAKLAAADEYLKSQPSGLGAYESNLPTEQDVLDVIAAEQPTYTISDTTFKPDYSLTTGSPVIPEIGAQGIQVPTINEVIDVVNQPVDYSLPIPETVTGLNIPPVLGDASSFINQPAPDSGVTISEPVETPMTQEELTKKLAEIDLAKTAANLAAGALTAGAVVNAINSSGSETPTGYDIVPVPSEWMSPIYNQAFTPSAPINFGSPELLRGTQWENPATLSSIINSMNVQPQLPSFMQTFNAPTTVGVGDVIGNLGGKPMSIADIISGIQSGQNYSS